MNATVVKKNMKNIGNGEHLQVDDERMPNHKKNVLLVVDVFHLLQTNYFGNG